MIGGHMKKVLLALVLAVAFSAAACAVTYLNAPDDSSAVSGKYTTMSIGAAASGMGNAYLGASKGAVSIYWNPAGIAGIKNNESEWNMFFAHNMALMNMTIENIAVAKSFKDAGVFAASVSYYGSDSMDMYSIDSGSNPVDLNRTFRAYAAGGSIAYANTLDKDIDYGITAKYFYDNIADDSTSVIAFDIGLRYFFSPLKGLSFNIAAKNLGGQLGGDTMDKEVGFGALYTADIEKWIVTAAYDVIGKIRNVALHRAGLEIKTPYYVTLRSGYFSDNNLIESGFSNVTFGLGINIDQKYAVDFSFEPYGELGNTYKTSFSADF